MESSSAVINSNSISQNILSNIALGGSNSENTLVINNKIWGGHHEGIYIVNSGNSWIIRNQVLK